MQKIISKEGAIQELHVAVAVHDAEVKRTTNAQELEKLFMKNGKLYDESVMIGRMLTWHDDISFVYALHKERKKLTALGNEISHKL